MELIFKKMSNMKFEEAHELFNKGFEGYMIPMNLNIDQFVDRFGTDGLSAELSVVAFHDNSPIGFVLQGIKEEGGLTISWNGGTGIIPEYRGKQIGFQLIMEAEKLLLEKEVDIATLEALTENIPAIRLYEKSGYHIADQLLFLSGPGPLVEKLPELDNYELERIPAFQTIGTNIFPSLVPWQTAASNVSKVGGEVVVLKKDGAIKGACLLRKRGVYGEKPTGITLFQLAPYECIEEVVLLLAHALEFDMDLTRSTYNFSEGNGEIVGALLCSGFEETQISQVFMTKKL